jgi:hypothetical protein
MATFFERVVRSEDWETDGGAIDHELFEDLIVLYESGDFVGVDAAFIKTQLGLTTGQGDEFDELLATMPPGTGLPRARWTRVLFTVLRLGVRQGTTGFETAADLRAALGLA